MKSTVETLTPTRVKITVEVPFEELKPSLDAAYKKIASQINVPGFRRGKVPAAIIDRQIGRGAALDDAINAALPKWYVGVLQENDVQPLGQPDIEITKFEDGETIEFTAELDVRPSIELPAYDGLEVTVDALAVSEDDVNEQVEAMRKRFGALKDVERAAATDDYVDIDLKATSDGEVVEGAEVAGMSYQLGRGGMVPGLDEALEGMAAGDSKTFESELVGGDQKGEAVLIEVTVNGVKEQELPELDDEFAQMASEFDTVDEFVADVRERLGNGKRLEQAAAARDAVLEKLLDLVEVPLPENVVADELNARRESIEQQLAYAGMDMAEYLDNEEQTIDEFEADLEKRVRDAVAAQFILDEIVKAEEVNLEQDELMQELFRRAQQSGQNPNEYIQHMMEHNHIPDVVSDVVRGKALALVMESATVTDSDGAAVNLKDLRPDGTLAPAGEAEAAEAEAPAREAAE